MYKLIQKEGVLSQNIEKTSNNTTKDDDTFNDFAVHKNRP